jgi:hypothetical protein
MFERLKSAMSRFCEALWQSFYEARAESRAGAQSARSDAQPAQLDAGHPFFESEAIKAALIDVVRGAYADGVQAERKRVETILQAPGASTFLEIAADLAVGPATAAQAAAVLARAEADAATRAAAIKSNLLESTRAVLH